MPAGPGLTLRASDLGDIGVGIMKFFIFTFTTAGRVSELALGFDTCCVSSFGRGGLVVLPAGGNSHFLSVSFVEAFSGFFLKSIL